MGDWVTAEIWGATRTSQEEVPFSSKNTTNNCAGVEAFMSRAPSGTGVVRAGRTRGTCAAMKVTRKQPMPSTQDSSTGKQTGQARNHGRHIINVDIAPSL